MPCSAQRLTQLHCLWSMWFDCMESLCLLCLIVIPSSLVLSGVACLPCWALGWQCLAATIHRRIGNLSVATAGFSRCCDATVVHMGMTGMHICQFS
jgi:hypothetical protein